MSEPCDQVGLRRSLREACGDRALSVRRRLASPEASEDDREEAPSTGHTRAVWRHGKCASVGLRYRCSQEAVERSRRGGEQGPRPRRELLKFPRVAGMDAHMTRPGENVREPVESVTGDFQEAFHSGGGGGGQLEELRERVVSHGKDPERSGYGGEPPLKR